MARLPIGAPSRLLLALTLAAAASGCGRSADSATTKAGPPPVSVEVVAVPREPIVDIVDLVGQLEAEESVELKPETSGVVRSVAFEDGDEVAAGALLFELRDDEERAKLHEAEAKLTLAEDELGRTRQLAAQKTVSPSELDRAIANAEAARARRDLAQVELDRMHIRAPFDGVLGAREVSPGDRVSKTTKLVRIDAVRRLRLLFTVPETVLNVAHTGNTVAIAVAPYPGEQFPGSIYYVAPTLDPVNRRLALKAWVPNAEHRLKPGLFANIRLEVARREDALVVPESSVAYDADGVFVWRVTPARSVERVPVELGIRQGGRVEIAHGLTAGDRIVAAGTHKVAPGVTIQEVAPVDAGSPPAHGSDAG
ncbi:MAG: efflux RND transporter periplasmic adaptor subunit [Deltaproteobacteria bacterium]|nr:efflux RND transporter periplasmic adaptor subunit [Deltaproteobacteria bacterium]